MLTAVAGRVGLDRRDTPADLLYAVGFFAAYLVLDVLTRAVSGLDIVSAAEASLLLGALGRNPLPAVILVAGTAALVWRSPARTVCRWSDLDRGPLLRWFVLPMVVVLTWEGALYEYNFVLDRAHLFDRFLLVALAAGVLARPALLVPFAIQSRIITGQFEFPFGSVAGENVDDLLVIVLLAVAGAHVMYVITGRVDSASVMLVIIAAVAAHFFIPGKGKVALDWLVHDDLANMATNGYTVGWLGQTDGGFALRLSDLVGTFGWPMRVGTLVLELGAAIVVVNYRLFRLWLPFAMVFHIMNFLLLGFWFLAWLVVELALLVLLGRPDARTWLAGNLTIGRAGLSVAAVVVASPLLFHPPGLAWFDSPIAYGYELNAVGVSGTRYNVPVDALAPFQQEIAFSRIRVGQTQHATGPYGVVVSVEELALLDELQTLDEVAAYERPIEPGDEQGRAVTEDFLAAWVRRANERARSAGLADVVSAAAPIAKYWTGRPEPRYSFQEPILQLEVVRVTGLRTDAGFEQARLPVLMLDAAADGTVMATTP